MRPLVLLHGFACEPDHFDGLISEFPERRAHAIAWRDHLDCSRPPVDAVSDLVDHLAAHLQERDLADAVMVGHSLGGELALLLAARCDLSASGVVMIDASQPLTSDRREKYVRIGRSFLDKLAVDSQECVQADFAEWAQTRFREQCFLTDDDPALIDRIVAQVSRSPVGPNAIALVGAAQQDTEAALVRIECPILAVGSSHPFTSIGDLRALRPDVEYRQTRRGGHFVMFFAAEELADFVGGFLSDSIVD